MSEQQQWEEFKATHSKTYASPEEEQHRRGIFLETVQAVKEHNEKFAKGEVTYEMGLTKFSDLTKEERANLHGGRFPQKQ